MIFGTIQTTVQNNRQSTHWGFVIIHLPAKMWGQFVPSRPQTILQICAFCTYYQHESVCRTTVWDSISKLCAKAEFRHAGDSEAQGKRVRVGPLQPAFQDFWMCLSACVFPLPSFLSLFRPARSVWLPTVHAVARYTHISDNSTTTDRLLSGHGEVLGIRAKGNFDKEQQGVRARKQK